MKSLDEQKQLLQDIDSLLGKMKSEIDLLRNINYRYFLMHGNKVQNGLVSVPENISFDVTGEIDGDVECRMIDHDKIRIESNYQNISRELSRLS
jgi:hypothetical protein